MNGRWALPLAWGLALVPASLVPSVLGEDPLLPVPCTDPRGCPDLVVDAARMLPYRETLFFSNASCAVQEGMVQPGTRDLLRFTLTTPNQGPGDLIVGPPNPVWFEFHQCHNHWHFKQYADYRLWTPAGFAAWDALRAGSPGVQAQVLLEQHPELLPHLKTGEKRGFCVADVVSYGGGLAKFQSCQAAQGISVGWADEYKANIAGQWVDVTGLAGGPYVLEAEVNAEWLFSERDFGNNRASVPITV